VHKQVVLGLGVWAPYAALTSYPDAASAPQRYSLISLAGSTLAFAGGGVAFAPIKELRLGAVVGMLTGVFNTETAFSGCVPERFICAPEQASWDVLTQLSVGPIFAPTGELGVTVVPTSSWRIGAAVQLPVYVRSRATLDARLPSTPAFAKATQEGTSGEVAFNLPWTLRAGIEMRAVDHLRLELAFNYDRWSMHNAITLTPDDIVFKNVVGFPVTYPVPPVVLQRNFQDTVSVHLGGEYAIPIKEVTLDVRGGVSFETSAVPPAYESVLTIDQNKVTAALGPSVHWQKLRFDLTYAHVFGFDVNVDPATAKIAQVSPVAANPPVHPDIINGGHYSARANVLGLGMTYTFDPQPTADPPPPASPAPPATPATPR
jgi:long-chain fatty acid transport protein